MKRLRWQWHSILDDRGWQRLRDLLLIVVGLVGVTILHYTTSPESMKIHNIHRFLYLLPITYAGLFVPPSTTLAWVDDPNKNPAG